MDSPKGTWKQRDYGRQRHGSVVVRTKFIEADVVSTDGPRSGWKARQGGVGSGGTGKTIKERRGGINSSSTRQKHNRGGAVGAGGTGRRDEDMPRGGGKIQNRGGGVGAGGTGKIVEDMPRGGG